MNEPSVSVICELRNSVEKLTSIFESCRVGYDTAREILISNKGMMISGNFRYYQIKDLGLNVYGIRLRPVGSVDTVVVEEWEEHLPS